MFGSLSNSWELFKTTFSVIRKDKEIILLPILSGIIMIAIGATYIGAIFFTGFLGFGFTPLIIVGFFVMYLLFYFIGFFFNAAVIGCATIRLKGGDPTLKDGLRIASENAGAIFLWAIVAATVGLILRAIEERVGFIGKIIISLIGFAWTMATFFVIPVIIYEKKSTFKSIKRSAYVFKDTWGETFIAHFGLGLIFFLLGLLGILFIILGAVLAGLIGLIIGLIIAIMYWVIIAAIGSAAQGVLTAALYRFATTGKINPEVLPPHLVKPYTVR